MQNYLLLKQFLGYNIPLPPYCKWLMLQNSLEGDFSVLLITKYINPSSMQKAHSLACSKAVQFQYRSELPRLRHTTIIVPKMSVICPHDRNIQEKFVACDDPDV